MRPGMGSMLRELWGWFADRLLSANLYVLLCVQWKTPDDGQRNCPKYVEFYSKNKYEKLVQLVGFITRTFHDARSAERQIKSKGRLLFRNSETLSSQIKIIWLTAAALWAILLKKCNRIEGPQ